jgi:hypothetical protein
MPLNDVMSPILAAYFEGKRMREDRENKIAQQQFQQQKLQQEAEQLSMEKDFKDRTLDYNKRHLEATTADLAARRAEADANISGQWFERLAKYGPPKQPAFQAPIDALSEQTSPIELPVKEFSVPGRPDIKIPTAGMDPLGSLRRTELNTNKRFEAIADQSSADREERLKAEEKWRKSDQENRLEIAKLNAAVRESIAEAKGGKQGGPAAMRVLGQLNTQANTAKNSQEGKNLVSSTRSMAKMEPYYNRTYKAFDDSGQKDEKLIGTPNGVDDTNLIMDYLQTTTPSNRITDFEFKNTAYSDSKANEIRNKVEQWVNSKKLTHEVRRRLMNQIKTIHEANLQNYENRISSSRDAGKVWAEATGVDPATVDRMFAASSAPYTGGSGKGAEKEKKPVPGDPSTYRITAAP